MLFRKKLSDIEKQNIINAKKDEIKKQIQDTYIKYLRTPEIMRLAEDVISVDNCISVDLEHPAFAKVYFVVDNKKDYKSFDYINYGLNSLSTIEHPIQCLAFIKIISQKLNNNSFELFLNDEDRYNSHICEADYNGFIDKYLEKSFSSCVIQEKLQVHCSFQLLSFDILSLRKKDLNKVTNW